MIPTGQNPTGTTQSPQRRRDIHRVAEEFDLIIIEDDPYYFLPLVKPPTTATADCGNPTSSVAAFLATLPPSYLSLDTSGRVIRLDSTSKILAPGLRCGWVTACEAIADKFVAYTEVSMVSVSGPTQLLLVSLLDETWGHEGFFRWLSGLAGRYRDRAGVLEEACERLLPTERCEWRVSEWGMFLWVQVKVDSVSDEVGGSGEEGMAGRRHVHEVEDRIVTIALANGVQVTKGSLFETKEETYPGTVVHLRLTFAAAALDEIAQGIERLAEVLTSV
jgi:aromatic amino acid aminotransferase I / 2-aminoadipate transaminase